jgi:hypothetical protein
MNNLLIFFALPIAIIILSSIFETFIKSPCKIAGIAFSIFIVTAFALGGNSEYIIITMIYTALAYISAFITSLFMRRPINFNRYQIPPYIPNEIDNSEINDFSLNSIQDENGFRLNNGSRYNRCR